MDRTSSNSNGLLNRAREGSDAALGELLDGSRSYLRLVAAAALDSDLRGKLSASDLIQETFVEAKRDFSSFDGESQARFRAWLRQIMINNLLNQYRHYRETQMRQLSRETGFAEAGLHAAALPGNGESPSHAAISKEERTLLDRALEKLTQDHRQVIELRHSEQLSFPEIGQRMNRSVDAARMLWYRAFEQLSKKLDRRNGSGTERRLG